MSFMKNLRESQMKAVLVIQSGKPILGKRIVRRMEMNRTIMLKVTPYISYFLLNVY
jgi:hypothetical protein